MDFRSCLCPPSKMSFARIYQIPWVMLGFGSVSVPISPLLTIPLDIVLFCASSLLRGIFIEVWFLIPPAVKFPFYLILATFWRFNITNNIINIIIYSSIAICVFLWISPASKRVYSTTGESVCFGNLKENSFPVVDFTFSSIYSWIIYLRCRHTTQAPA